MDKNSNSNSGAGKGKTILLVGHCGPDASMLRSALRSFLPGAAFEVANDENRFAKFAPASHLLLVNRVLDGDFAVPAGLDLLARLKQDAATASVPFLLISDIPEAQAEAQRRGASPGFGKRALRSDDTRARVLAALGLSDKLHEN